MTGRSRYGDSLSTKSAMVPRPTPNEAVGRKTAELHSSPSWRLSHLASLFGAGVSRWSGSSFLRRERWTVFRYDQVIYAERLGLRVQPHLEPLIQQISAQPAFLLSRSWWQLGSDAVPLRG